MPQSVCLTTASPCARPSATSRSNAIGRVVPRSVRSPSRSARRRSSSTRGRAERDVLPLEHLVVDRLLDVRLVAVVERLHPAGALAHASATWRRRRASTARLVAERQRSAPRGDVDQQVVTRLRRPRRCGASAPRACRCRARGRRSRAAALCHTALEGDTDGSRAGPHVLDGRHGRRELRTICDLELVIPCVEGGSVIEKTGADAVKAEIVVRMGAMSMKFTGTVEITEKDEAAHRAVMTVKSREAGGQGHANATVEFTLRRRRRHDPHERADHRQGRVDGRGRRARRARRADHRLHGQARQALTGAGHDAGGTPGRGTARRRHRDPGGRRPPGVHAATDRTTTSARAAATCSPRRWSDRR